MKIKTLTKREYEIMNVFWNEKEAMGLHDIIQNYPELNRNTVQAVLKKLLESNYIEVDKIGYSNTVLTRKYIAKLTQDTYLKQSLSKQAAYQIALDFIKMTATNNQLEKLESAILERKALSSK